MLDLIQVTKYLGVLQHPQAPSCLRPCLGKSPCKRPHCKACAHITTGTVFNSTTTGAQFRVKATADCGTRNVVYLIECKRCTIQYIGETENALHVRLTRHRLDIKNGRIEEPVAKHFSLPSHSIDYLKIMIKRRSTRKIVSIENGKKAAG